LTVPRLEALGRYWQRFPPVHVLVAAYMGVKGGAEAEKPLRLDQGEGLEALLSMGVPA
jgi:hypothetical protein